jgi:hypothetical protein
MDLHADSRFAAIPLYQMHLPSICAWHERNSTQTKESNTMIKLSIITLTVALIAGAIAQAQTSPAATTTDSQIAMIAVTGDNVDIKLAAKKASNPKVKEFAELMLRAITPRSTNRPQVWQRN